MATMADWARPALGFDSWITGWMETKEIIRRIRRLICSMCVSKTDC